MRYASDTAAVLACPVKSLSGPGCAGGLHKVSDVGELLWHVLNLQQHDELNIVLTSGESLGASEWNGSAGHRGYLMDIELGATCTVCVKRTF